MKILVIGPSWVGDMVMSQCLYRTLKVEYSSTEIDVISVAWCRPLLARMPEVHRTLPFSVGHGSLAITERWRLGHALRKNQYDRAYVLPNSWKSALVPFFANVAQRIGWCGEKRYGLLNDIRMLNKAAFPRMAQRYLALAYDKGRINCADDLPKPLLCPQLQVNKEEIGKSITTFKLTVQRPSIGFCPGAAFGPAKCWPHYHFVTLAKKLIDQGYQVVLFGSDNDYAVGEKIQTALQGKSRKHCINLAGKTKLDHAVVLISSCKAIISNDSGLMHIAAALNKPLIALYGPSSPDFTPPLSDKAKVIRLIRGYHKVRKANTAHGYHQSLIDVQPQQVLEALMSLLVESEG
ncbi:ADP-heptose--LPS heptosyltransferase 2 [Serratia symbiotica]|nr:ADP-heptose--LPS heptosyltransferase 2 [Serratia symbiotica]